MSEKTQDQKTKFLKEFVQVLINKSRPKRIYPPIRPLGFQEPRQILLPPYLPQRSRIMKITPIPQRQRTMKKFPIVQPSQQQTPLTPQETQSLGLQKVLPILQNPAVLSVECPGPGKNLLVNASGRIETAPTLLTSNEINSALDAISEKTKIPIISGVFKAAFSNFIITAVISDYVGTRFIIQKKMPQIQR
ncbi:hypothetical protein CMI47_03385 [Candidatus Pacearchaeota archaeon]|nr:hypothetical protein [Candidatus Pacearchaeota archaeon]|tara:strand:- start:1805 stop:2377 length:573 start_codon:yes stop_codon:yes gene_type:complete